LGIIKLKSATGGTGQIFYFSDLKGTTERDSVRFEVPAGEWHTARVRLPALPPGTRFRFDPPGNGDCVLASIALQPRKDIQPPEWSPLPADSAFSEMPHTLKSGEATLRVGDGWDHWQLQVAGDTIARGHRAGMIGHQVVREGKPALEWLHLEPKAFNTRTGPQGEIITSGTVRDSDGCSWEMQRTNSAGPEGRFDCVFSLTVDRDRSLVWLPALMAVAGRRGGHGTLESGKKQALLAGVEYLDDEPSSSKADILGPAHQRRVPDPVKLTMPLMAWQSGKQWLSIHWKEKPNWTPIFDTPDRTLGTGGHLLGMILPGADPGVRGDGDLFPFAGIPLPARQTITLQLTLSAGRGENITAAVRHHLKQNPLPALPPKPTLEAYTRLATLGWLESGLAGAPGTYRHAVMGELMGPQPASDAAWMLEWLSGNLNGGQQAKQAQEASKQAWAKVEAPGRFHAMVGHLREPVAIFLGERADLEAGTRQAGALVQQTLARFEPDGTIRYRGTHPADLARTQPSLEANGLTSRAVVDLIQAAIFSGDSSQMEKALAKLKALDRFQNSVPRGAQTWEVPLHTPDILASGHLVEAYRLAYEVTGDKKFLEKAIDWAWTGVPFVYQRKPAAGPIGEYATIAVLGATHYEAPVWIGLPVQWCGLVYADAIARLARHDAEGPWEQLSTGITLSAMQQVYPAGTTRQGLLPDSFSLRSQIRNPADINPGTLQPLAMRILANSWSYDTLGIPGSQVQAWLVGPGKFDCKETADNEVDIRFTPWRKGNTSWVLFGGTGWQGLSVKTDKSVPESRLVPLAETSAKAVSVNGPTCWRIGRKGPVPTPISGPKRQP
jgi:hypothetical protein